MQRQLAQFSIDIGTGQRLSSLINSSVGRILDGNTASGRGNVRTPSAETLESIVSGLAVVLFPELHSGGSPQQKLAQQLRLSLSQLGLELRHALESSCDYDDPRQLEGEVTRQLEQFTESLPELRRLLATDAQAIHDGDPSSRSRLEVLLSSPGLLAMLHHRIAHQLEGQGVRFSEPELKRVPAPYDKDHPRGDLLRRKGLAAWLDGLPMETAYGEDGPENCVREFARLEPVFAWLMRLNAR